MGGLKKMTEKGMTYAEAGVDIDTANEVVKSIKEIVAPTLTDGVKSMIGGFSAIFEVPVLAGQKSVRLHSSTDGVGTKLKIAFLMNKHDTVGIDLVAMCVNDLLVRGVPPLFFLDYLATGKLELGTTEKIISGIAKGCLQAGCALIGGECAEMPGFYREGEYDLAGFTVGAETAFSLGPDQKAQVGDCLIGLPSSGLHSNGYSLVRKICFEKLGLTVNSYIEEFGRTLGEELLEPTRIYVKSIMGLLEKVDVHGMANITGGGFIDNIPRMLADDAQAVIQSNVWSVLPIFSFLQKNGPVDEMEMYRTFNNGIGMVISVSNDDLFSTMNYLALIGEECFYIGDVEYLGKEKDRVVFR